MVDVTELVLGFVFGVISGSIIQHLRFKYSLKIEKIRRLTPLLEAAYPIVDNLADDSDYAKSIQVRGNDVEFRRILENVGNSLDEYEKWFSRFQLSGVSPALESIDSELLARFNGIFTHTRLFKMHGISYLSQNIDEFAEYCVKCRRMLKVRLSS